MNEHESADGHEDVGSLSEEAARLVEALSGWARTQGTGAAANAAGAAQGLAAAFRDGADHIATGDDSCRYCPICQLISAVKDTRPEVKLHLAAAASSLVHAAAAMLATTPPREPEAATEHIDLDDDEGGVGPGAVR